MKGKLEFNLPEEQTEFIRASRADIAWNKLYDIDMQLRNWIKHGHDNLSKRGTIESITKHTKLHETEIFD